MYLEKMMLQTLLGKPEVSRSSKNNPTYTYQMLRRKEGHTFFHATTLTVVMFSSILIILPG